MVRITITERDRECLEQITREYIECHEDSVPDAEFLAVAKRFKKKLNS